MIVSFPESFLYTRLPKYAKVTHSLPYMFYTPLTIFIMCIPEFFCFFILIPES